MEDDEERLVDGVEAAHKTPQDQGEKTCHGGEGDKVATEPAVEHGPMVDTGAGAGRSKAAGNDAVARPPESREEHVADEEGVRPRGGGDPREDGRDASETERQVEHEDVAQTGREGREHAVEQEGGVQRGDTWKGADAWPRERRATEPMKMSRTRTVEVTADPWKQAGMQTSHSTKVWPAKRHALLIALSPDGEYMQPGERHWESATVDTETQYMNAAPREAAQRRPLTRMDGCTLTWTCPEGLKRTGRQTGDTWSLRLRRGTGSSSRALCTCNTPGKMQRGPQTDVTALIQAVADKMASKKGRAGTTHSLLQDLAVFVRERNGDEDK